MAKKKDEFAVRMDGLGYPDYEVKPWEEGTPMLYIQDKLVCGWVYANQLSDEGLTLIIKERLACE